jgi:uncharacterized protein (DUF169 family)
MTLTNNDFSILEKLGLEIEPAGVKFLVSPPDGILALNQNMTLCEMLKHAQAGNCFYAGANHHTCDGGTYILGQGDVPEQFINGEFGAGLGVFSDTRAGSRLYSYVSKITRGNIKFVAFSPLSQISFDPDVLIIMAKTSQAEILLRASSYKTGKMWQSRYSAAMGCSWLFAYPYLSGEMNFISTGLGFGMRRRKLFPEGLHIISIPFDQIASLLQTLQEMPWVPRPYQPDGLEYVKQLRIKLGLDPHQNK